MTIEMQFPPPLMAEIPALPDFLVPMPWTRYTPVRERRTGYVFTDDMGGVVTWLCPLPDGERWRRHPWFVYRGDGYHIPESFDPAPHSRHFGLELGPSADEDTQQCEDWCGFLDGCATCQPDVWHACVTGNCPSRSRISVDDYPGDDCPCLTSCDDCGTRFNPQTESYYITAYEETVCDSCRWAHYSECHRCHRLYPDDSISDHEAECDSRSGCGDSDCGTCGTSSLINSYSYKPTPLFKGSAPYYLGLEVEIPIPDRKIREVAEYVSATVGDVAYLKEDGSVTGFEMVTHPMAYDWALANFPWRMFDRLADRYELSVEEDDDCGIHVHVSRSAFGDPSHLYRWFKWWHRNKDQIRLLARRRSHWAKFGKHQRAWALHFAKAGADYENRYQWSDGFGRPIAWWLKGKESREATEGHPFYCDRYSAINVQNCDTLEVRVFAGSLDAQEVQAAMGLVHASVEFTRGISAHDILRNGAWEWNSFETYLADKPQYTALSAEIERLVD